MSINISAFAGAGAQFFDANGVPLTGGLIYTYLAGTTTPAVTYTSKLGTSNNTNPIVLDAAGRTPAEIWMTGGVLYKFVLKSSTFVQIGSYDDIPAINDITTVNNLITVAGTNTLTGLATPTLIGYVAGAQYSFIAQNNNTGAVTLDIDTLGAKSITKAGSIALVANDIVAGALYQIAYDGTRFQLLTRTSTSQLVVGTTAQRPSSPTTGMVRMNTTTLNPEWYDTSTSSWLQFSQPAGYSVSYLVVAGGGGGGTTFGGGGGGGGLLTGTTSFSTGTAYTITIGAGGAFSTTGAAGASGGTSSIATVISTIGGGGGGTNGATAGTSGGSGGGGSDNGTTTAAAGSGTSGQGNAGSASGLGGGGGGGGGGAGAAGSNKNGGTGASNIISGATIFYAGGGGGYNTGTGGSGGGGAFNTNGSVNTGGGGGGNSTGLGNGGSGIVIISYLGGQRGTGGLVTSVGGYTIHTFTASGTYNA